MSKTAPPPLACFPNSEILLVYLGLADDFDEATRLAAGNPLALKTWSEAFLSTLASEHRRSQILIELYSQTRTELGCKTATRLAGCQHAHWVLIAKHDCKAAPVVVGPYQCNQRACPHCARQRSLDLYIRTQKAFPPSDLIARKLSKVVFSIKSPACGSLKPHLDNLLKAFRQFRRGKAWAAYVRGYIFGLELTYNATAATWHPHIHVLADMDYWPIANLRRDWRAAAARRNEKADVHIDGVVGDLQSLYTAISEATKYVLKPMDEDMIHSGDLLELTTALRNLRMHGSGGSLTIPGVARPEGLYALYGGLSDTMQDPDLDPRLRLEIVAAIHRDPQRSLQVAASYHPDCWT